MNAVEYKKNEYKARAATKAQVRYRAHQECGSIPPEPSVKRAAGTVRATSVAALADSVTVAATSVPTPVSRAGAPDAPALPVKISISSLDLFYSEFQALKDVNLDIASRQIMAFIGPSGCGKSTLLKSLNRMNDLVEGCRIEGRITLDGEDVYKGMDVNLLRKRVGMVFQKPNPFPMSVFDNVAFGPRTHGVRKRAELEEIVEKSLRDAAIFDELKDRLKKNALGLSGGQQQRLCIARALAVQPEVLLMDEPTSALDPISTNKIEDLVVQLKRDYTIVMVTHNMQQAARISDTTAFFLLGEVIEVGRTEQVFSLPHDKRTEDYITGRFG